MTEPTPLERAIETALTAGLAVSSGLLVGGLLLDRADYLRWGTLLLMMTPVARVVVLTAGLAHKRDWLFASISLWILAVLGSSLFVALRMGLRL